jgi:hypothetical protein
MIHSYMSRSIVAYGNVLQPNSPPWCLCHSRARANTSMPWGTRNNDLWAASARGLDGKRLLRGFLRGSDHNVWTVGQDWMAWLLTLLAVSLFLSRVLPSLRILDLLVACSLARQSSSLWQNRTQILVPLWKIRGDVYKLTFLWSLPSQ